MLCLLKQDSMDIYTTVSCWCMLVFHNVIYKGWWVEELLKAGEKNEMGVVVTHVAFFLRK